MLKAQIINEILKREGGYVNDPRDSGGETNFGVTIKVARDHGYAGSMRDMPREVAFNIYVKLYWGAVKGDALMSISPELAIEIVDTAVNMGVSRASRFLQRALNVLTDADLVVDGKIGPATLVALGEYMVARNDDTTLCKALNCLQGAHYIKLAERREKDRAFVYGWLKNRVEI